MTTGKIAYHSKQQVTQWFRVEASDMRGVHKLPGMTGICNNDAICSPAAILLQSIRFNALWSLRLLCSVDSVDPLVLVVWWLTLLLFICCWSVDMVFLRYYDLFFFCWFGWCCLFFITGKLLWYFLFFSYCWFWVSLPGTVFCLVAIIVGVYFCHLFVYIFICWLLI